MSKHVFFDLDGTLLDTARDFTQVLNHMLGLYGRDSLSDEKVRETVSDGARALVRLGFEIDEAHPDFNKYLQELLDSYGEQITQSQAQLFPGIEALLQEIETRQFSWGIVTNKPSRFTTSLLKNFPVMSGSATTICADQLKQSKPDPEGLIQACKQIACTPDQCIYVGDHLRDIEAGKNAGMQTIAVTWGYFPADTELQNWQADFIADSPQAITHYLFG